MKANLALTVFTLWAAAMLVGCNQNNSGNATTDTPATNSIMPGTRSGGTNLLATNSLPDLHTNWATANQ